MAHSTKRGTEDTAVEVDKLRDNGLQKTEGTIKEIDHGGRKLVIESADRTEHTFKLSGHSAAESSKGVAAGTEKGTKVAVYSTEEAGKKVAPSRRSERANQGQLPNLVLSYGSHVNGETRQ